MQGKWSSGALTRIAHKLARNRDNRARVWTQRFEALHARVAEQQFKTAAAQWRKGELARESLDR